MSTDVVGGVTVTVDTAITDYTLLGRHLAHADSDEQANIFAGLAAGFQEFGWPGPSRYHGLMQLEFIREAVEAHNEREAIRWFVEELNARINPEEIR